MKLIEMLAKFADEERKESLHIELKMTDRIILTIIMGLLIAHSGLFGAMVFCIPLMKIWKII